jgi:uncharacterized cupredoxin-like copper-binding protein
MKRVFGAAAVVGVLATACGGGHEGHSSMNMGGSTSTSGAASAAARTVDIDMVDIAYAPTTLTVQRGERIEFVFHNKGQIGHDAFIGDTAAQAEHEKEMRGEGSMNGGHGMSEAAITVDPCAIGRLTYTFDKAGTLEIGCHQTGHYAAGMKVAVSVA